MFGLEDMVVCRHTAPSFLTESAVLLANASSGLWVLIQKLAPPQVWLPSYLCGSIAGVVVKAGLLPKYYEVSPTLVPASLDWLEDVQPNDLIIGIDYFGFPMDTSWVAMAKSKGAWIVEDACQALLSNFVGAHADFVLFSPRKFLGVPDGGILLCKHPLEEKDGLGLTLPPSEWQLKTLNASLLRREFDLVGKDRHWFKLFQETERNHPVGLYAMSALSRNILTHCVDYPAIAQKRVENYKYLLQSLPSLAIFPALPEGVIPLGFPIRAQERDRIRQALFDAAIYPPVHWPIKDIVPGYFQDSHELAGHIMTLPCDQRYTLKDMARVAETVRQSI